ncbi:MAG: hypothetical protein ACK58C_07665 [Betaproteobacteria bacterium]
MKYLISAALVCATLTGSLAAAQTGAPTEGAPALVVADRFVIDVDVVAVDQSTRKVTLKSADGRTSTVTAGPEVKNLAQLKAGDKVRAQYSEALTVVLKKGSGLRSKTESSDSAAAAAGKKPAGAAMREVHIVADIVTLDAKTGAMRLKGPEGRTLDVKLKDPSVLQGYVAGDQVEAAFLQVLAIGASTPDGKK